MTLSQKIKVIIKSALLTVYYFALAFISGKNLQRGNSELIVSLTSYGKRVRFVFLTIETILQQSYPPKHIYLWLYKDDVPTGFDAWMLKRQQQRGLVISYVDRNTRSYKKLSPVYQMSDREFSYVITADDDILYPRNWLETFRHHYQQNPDYVYCYRARIISFDSSGVKMKKYSDWPLANNQNSVGNNVIPTGVSGICYPRESISDEVFDYAAIEAVCPYADDIWYKMITTHNKFESKLVVDHSTHFTPAITGFGKGLEKVNVYNDYNTTQFADSMNHFNIAVADFVGNTRMEMSQLVSIITPTYNASKYIMDVYASLKSQTHSNWEWLITDDCSTDDTLKILTDLSEQDARIKIVSNNCNVGAAITRNNSLCRAEGQFIAFIDSDDVWLPEKLEKQIRFMGDDICFSFTAYKIISDDGQDLGQTVDTFHTEPLVYKDMLKKKATLGCSTVMLRRGVIDDLTMPLLRTGQDYALWLKILKSGVKAWALTEMLTQYRIVVGSISRNKVKKAKRQWEIYRRVEELNVFYAAYCFGFYAWRAVFRR